MALNSLILKQLSHILDEGQLKKMYESVLTEKMTPAHHEMLDNISVHLNNLCESSAQNDNYEIMETL